MNVTFSPDSYTPHLSHGNSPHFQRSPPGSGRTDGQNGRGYGRNAPASRGRGNSDSQWTRDGQNMIKEPPVQEDTVTTLDSTVKPDP